MYMDQRTSNVHRLLADHVRSPSLRHIRDPHFLTKLALQIVKSLDSDGSVWRKWEGPRDTVISSALDCWIPNDDMLAFLNTLSGQPLTMTDLEQRMRHLIEVEYIASPEPDLQATQACRIADHVEGYERHQSADKHGPSQSILRSKQSGINRRAEHVFERIVPKDPRKSEGD